MNTKIPTLTRERLLEVLHYDPLTGVFKWRVRPSNRVKVGDIAGSSNERCLYIRVDGRRYQDHHLAWLIVTGEWPLVDQIDHRDTDKRTCMRCGEEKPISQMIRGRNMCKPCINVKQQERRSVRVDAYREYDRNYYQRNWMAFRISQQLYQLAFPRSKEQERQRGRRWRETHLEAVRESSRKSANLAASELSDSYVAAVVARRCGVSSASVPAGLIAAKRAHIQVTRQLSTKAILP